MTRRILSTALLLLLAMGLRPLLADQNDDQRNSSVSPASTNDQQQVPGSPSATDGNARSAEAGPALPAPDGSNSPSAAGGAQNQAVGSSPSNGNGQAQKRIDSARESSGTRTDQTRDSRREDFRDPGNAQRDQSDLRDGRGDYRRQVREQFDSVERAGPERSYLTRAPRQLPVYFGAEFDAQVEGVALVTRVDQGSPADRAGLHRDDIVM